MAAAQYAEDPAILGSNPIAGDSVFLAYKIVKEITNLTAITGIVIPKANPCGKACSSSREPRRLNTCRSEWIASSAL